MKRTPAVMLVIVLALALAAGAAVLAPRGATQPVYTVAQVTAGLAQRPGAWVGRTVRVRGRAVIALCPGGIWCPGTSALLVDLHTPGRHIALAWRSISPLLTALLHVPFVNGLIARRIGGTGVYRVLITRTTRMAPVEGLPNYYPYTNRTAPTSEDIAVLVGSVN